MPIRIDPLSVISIYLETYFNDTKLGPATGFVVLHEGVHFLITNWHVVSGRHPKTRNCIATTAAIPNKIKVWHHKKDALGQWVIKDYDLTEGSWKEIDLGDEMVDVIAYPFSKSNDIDLYPLDLGLAGTDLIIAPSDPVSIIGFPFGNSWSGYYQSSRANHIGTGKVINLFMGVYSGRLQDDSADDSNIGQVWNPPVIYELLTL